MSTTNQDLRRAVSSSPSRTTADAPDVVAGLQNDGSAFAVARAAAREAAKRGSRVRFVQVADDRVPPEEREEVDRSTFRVALQALKGLHRVPCTFEVVDGDPGPALVAHSTGAGLLVVGRDQIDGGRGVATHCQRHASCDVLTISAH